MPILACLLAIGYCKAETGPTYYHVAKAYTDPQPHYYYSSINNAYKALLNDSGGTETSPGELQGPVIIQVEDANVYEESVYISNLITTSTATLTVQKDPNVSGNPTIYPTEDAARPIEVNGTDFVTISGFIFMNNQINKADAMTGINFDGQAPADSQVTFDNCVWDGQGQTYGFKGILFCWQPHCNITVQNSTFQNIVVGTNLTS